MVRFVVLLVALLLAGASANAADYPTKPIRVIVPYAAGSTGEAALRVIANAVEPKLGQPVVIETRPGAAGNLGAAFVAKADPDGYTLLLGATNNFAINQYLYPNIGFDPLTAFEPIGVLVELPFFIYANPQLPAKSLSEVIELARQKPGTLNYASSGIGTPMHLGGVLLGRVAGVEMTHVPYRSSAQSVAALLAGDVQFYIGTVAGAPQLEQDNRLRILSSAGPRRAPTLPRVVSAAEAGLPNFEISNWWALAGAERYAAAGDRRAVARASRGAGRSVDERSAAADQHGRDRQPAPGVRRPDEARSPICGATSSRRQTLP